MTFCRLLTVSLLLSGCSNEIYLRDGVTDGDTFYLAQQALVDDDPSLQSWVSYSLTLSACKLAIGDDNPARASSFECELMARRHLVETWREQQVAGSDAYLDSLLQVYEAGLLPEYVAANFRRSDWALPSDLDLGGYRAFARQQLRNHEPVTRVVGSWNYARNVRLAQ
jgi:hypothetical protein